jgi:hypothetical protein
MLQKTFFANHQPDQAFQALETPIFTLNFAKPIWPPSILSGRQQSLH